MKRTNSKCLPDTTNIQRKNIEQTENIYRKIRTHTGQLPNMCIRHTRFHSVSSLVLSLQDAQIFPTNLTNITRHERFWRMTALRNNNEYNPFLVRRANPAKCDRGITHTGTITTVIYLINSITVVSGLTRSADYRTKLQ